MRALEDLVVEGDAESFKVQLKKQEGRRAIVCLFRKTNPEGGKTQWKQICQLVIKDLSAGLAMLLAATSPARCQSYQNRRCEVGAR